MIQKRRRSALAEERIPLIMEGIEEERLKMKKELQVMREKGFSDCLVRYED